MNLKHENERYNIWNLNCATQKLYYTIEAKHIKSHIKTLCEKENEIKFHINKVYSILSISKNLFLLSFVLNPFKSKILKRFWK